MNPPTDDLLNKDGLMGDLGVDGDGNDGLGSGGGSKTVTDDDTKSQPTVGLGGVGLNAVGGNPAIDDQDEEKMGGEEGQKMTDGSGLPELPKLDEDTGVTAEKDAEVRFGDLPFSTVEESKPETMEVAKPEVEQRESKGGEFNFDFAEREEPMVEKDKAQSLMDSGLPMVGGDENQTPTTSVGGGGVPAAAVVEPIPSQESGQAPIDNRVAEKKVMKKKNGLKTVLAVLALAILAGGGSFLAFNAQRFIAQRQEIRNKAAAGTCNSNSGPVCAGQRVGNPSSCGGNNSCQATATNPTGGPTCACLPPPTDQSTESEQPGGTGGGATCGAITCSSTQYCSEFKTCEDKFGAGGICLSDAQCLSNSCLGLRCDAGEGSPLCQQCYDKNRICNNASPSGANCGECLSGYDSATADGTCVKGCSGPSDCGSITQYCSAGSHTCVPKKSNGNVCSGSLECMSRNCSGGVCLAAGAGGGTPITSGAKKPVDGGCSNDATNSYCNAGIRCTQQCEQGRWNDPFCSDVPVAACMTQPAGGAGACNAATAGSCGAVAGCEEGKLCQITSYSDGGTPVYDCSALASSACPVAGSGTGKPDGAQCKYNSECAGGNCANTAGGTTTGVCGASGEFCTAQNEGVYACFTATTGVTQGLCIKCANGKAVNQPYGTAQCPTNCGGTGAAVTPSPAAGTGGGTVGTACRSKWCAGQDQCGPAGGTLHASSYCDGSGLQCCEIDGGGGGESSCAWCTGDSNECSAAGGSYSAGDSSCGGLGCCSGAGGGGGGGGGAAEACRDVKLYVKDASGVWKPMKEELVTWANGNKSAYQIKNPQGKSTKSMEIKVGDVVRFAVQPTKKTYKQGKFEITMRAKNAPIGSTESLQTELKNEAGELYIEYMISSSGVFSITGYVQ